MNGDSSPGTGPGLRTGVGCDPVMELARYVFGGQKEKDQSEGCLKDQARASDSLALGAGSQFHIAPSANPGGGTGNHRKEEVESQGRKAPLWCFPGQWPTSFCQAVWNQGELSDYQTQGTCPRHP